MVAKYTEPNFTTQQAAFYKAAIDAAFSVHHRLAGPFAAHEQDSGSPQPDMSVRIDAGSMLSGVTLTEAAAQTVSGFTTPSAGQHRIDRVVVDAITGVASRVAGTAVTGSPTATPPAIPSGKVPCCRVLITSADTVITNSMITDERTPRSPMGADGASHTLIRSQSASSSTTIDFTSGIDSTYDHYVLTFSGVVPQTDNVSLLLRVTENGGSTWEADAADYEYELAVINGGTLAFNNSVGATQIVVATAAGSAPGEALSGKIEFFMPSSASLYKSFMIDYAQYSKDALTLRVLGTGLYNGSQAAINGVRFLMSSGNIASGTFNLYGVRKT